MNRIAGRQTAMGARRNLTGIPVLAPMRHEALVSEMPVCKQDVIHPGSQRNPNRHGGKYRIMKCYIYAF